VSWAELWRLDPNMMSCDSRVAWHRQHVLREYNYTK
jgi:hypothetical protein